MATTIQAYPKIPQAMRRTRALSRPSHFTLLGGSSGWVYDILKVNRNLDHERASAFCKVQGFATDYGDTYINDILSEDNLVCTHVNGQLLAEPKPVNSLVDFHTCCVMAAQA